MVRIAGFHPADPGSSPGVGIARLAQLVERRTFNPVVVGSSPTMGMIDVLKGQGFILRLREDLPSEILSDLPMSELSSCDAWLLHEGILNPVLDGNGDLISFAHNLEDLTVPGNGGGPQLVFLLNPMRLDLFEILVSQGQRLPPKTTYFAPKVPTGIVIHSLQGFV